MMKTISLGCLAVIGMIACVAFVWGGLSCHASMEETLKHQNELRSIRDRVQKQLSQGLAVVDRASFYRGFSEVFSANNELIDADRFYRNVAFSLSALSLVVAGASTASLIKRPSRKSTLANNSNEGHESSCLGVSGE